MSAVLHRSLPCFLALFAALAFLGLAAPACAASDADLAAAVAKLGEPGFSEKLEAIETLATLGDTRAVPALQALTDGNLYLRDADNLLVVATEGDPDYRLSDPLTGAALGSAGFAELSRVIANNRLRSAIHTALAKLQIGDPDPTRRLAAAQEIARDNAPETAALLSEVLEHETNAGVRAAIAISLAKINLSSELPAERLAALKKLSDTLTLEVRTLLAPLTSANSDGSFAEPDPTVRKEASLLVSRIDRRLVLQDLALNLFQGISLGSVLLLAAVGLAITFGVMGVINMAHGEMIMLGAYTAFCVQEAFRMWLPESVFGLYLIVSIPAAFVVAGLVGIALERGIIRFLYGRPLETLLATWGISLILQQVVRSVFGAPNREVSNPAWMTGAFEPLPGMVLTWNRISIILFALAVLVAIGLLMRFTSYGLQMRAVTQNRPMAAAMGIPSGWVDALTFGLGSGIAGVAGVALSQVGNVSPNLGQTYIVDSFMVVVFGGVGSLWGVLAGAMSLGIVNKILEPYAGAMLGKILVLVLLILFIQKRPRGLFALRGRAAEA
ncbi:MAG: urea ABC transporter permease subunit UrtB [Azospirillum sp.]|nr:urea ABC transporter permease subunit UrtB [Azospirillum sp.]